MSEQEADGLLGQARALSEQLNESLPSIVRAAGLTSRSKLPFKAVLTRELLLHRTAALSRAAVDHFLDGEPVPAIILTRAIIENAAVLFGLISAIEKFLRSPDLAREKRLDDFLMKALMGARWEDHPVKAEQILNLIDDTDKAIPGFRNMYDMLSEFAHPNWSGLHGSFGEYDQQKLELVLGLRNPVRARVIGCSALANALDVFQDTYNELPANLRKLDEFFEENGSLAHAEDASKP
jgi:hypothetical protein